MTEDSKISFTKDVLQEASKQLGIEIGKVESVYESMMLYLHELMNNTGYTAIFIPHFGTLHVKLGFVKEKMEQYEKSGDEEKLKIWTNKYNEIVSHIKEMTDNKYKGKSRHIEMSNISSVFYNGGKKMSEIEEIQNAR